MNNHRFQLLIISSMLVFLSFVHGMIEPEHEPKLPNPRKMIADFQEVIKEQQEMIEENSNSRLHKDHTPSKLQSDDLTKGLPPNRKEFVENYGHLSINW